MPMDFTFRKILKIQQVMHLPGAKNWSLHKKRKMAAWSFFRLWKVGDSTLFQMAFVLALLATVLGDCDTPPKLEFASLINVVNETTFKTGTILKYTCRPGYSRSSSSMTLTCDIGGRWSFITFCTRKRCRNPGEITNGQVEIKTDLNFGSHIEFHCLEGYILIGSTISYCEIHDKGVDWSDPLPTCTPVLCEPPPDISNGRHTGVEEVYSYGTSVTYTCDSYYSLLGQPSIACSVENNTGVWKPDPPACKKITCPQPVVPNGTISSGFGYVYMFKQSVMFTCKKGYILKGSRIIQCEEDNNWHPALPTCELNSCTNLPEIPNADWQVYNHRKPRKGDMYPVGTVLRYQCYSGYRSVASEPMTLTCQADLTWTTFRGCEKICCPKPQLKKGKIIEQRISASTKPCDYFYGDHVFYSCHESYRFDAICQADGTWSPKTPTCSDTCSFPPNITHGRFKHTSSFFHPRSQVSYECDDGYTLFGSGTIYCSSVWSPPPPQCKAKCLKPKIENGHLLQNKNVYYEGENITVRCNPGYTVVGTQSIHCSENRTWYPEVFKCEWEVPEGCEPVLASQHLLKCLPQPEMVKLTLEVYKLSLEIEKLERENKVAIKCPVEYPL